MGNNLSVNTQTSNGQITVGNVIGDHALTLNAGSGNITLSSLGASGSAIPTPTLTNSGTRTVQGNWYLKSSALNLGAIILSDDFSIDIDNQNITLGNITGSESDHTLSLDSGTGSISLAQLGENSTALGNVSLTGASLSTSGSNWYTGNISGNIDLTNTAALTISAGSVDFNDITMQNNLTINASSTIDAASITGTNHNLTLSTSASNSNITLTTLGSSGNALGTVSITPHGSGKINTSGNWFTNQITLGDVAMSNIFNITTSDDAISIGDVTGDYALTLSAGTENITLASLGTSSARISFPTLTHSGTKTVSGTWYLKDDAHLALGALILGNNFEINIVNKNITLGNITSSAAKTLTLNSGTGIISLANLGSNSQNLGNISLTGGSLSVTGNNWYTGNISGNIGLTSNGARL